MPVCTASPRFWIGLFVCAHLLASPGCASISVRKVAAPEPLDSWQASAVTGEKLSPRTLQTLRRWDLDQLYDRSPTDAHSRLQAVTLATPEPELVFALAETSYLLGRRAEKRAPAEACAFYYLCAGYAYHYLFPVQDRPDAASPLVFDPRFRLACDLYNAGLAKCIRAAQKDGQLDPRQHLRLHTPDGQGCLLSVVHHGFAWRPEEFGPFLFCADYEVVGLANHYRGYGLGVPLIGTRAGSTDTPGPAFYPLEVSFPVTAFLRFDGDLADLSARRAGRLELYNPLAVAAIEVHGRAASLEADLTTPLAYFLSRTDLQGIEYGAFLRADKLKDRTGIYMVEPYQPGKIPVVMMHGLLSSPLTWAPQFNDLRADPVLREHFQFWFYLYPTGNPYLAAAADLREALARLRAELDPERRDPALDQMVFVGHSMGGLIAKLLTVDSGDDFWHLVSLEPFDSLRVRPETRSELQRLFFFTREPGVKRVVFLGTPHHGSKLSHSLLSRLAVRFVRLPKKLLTATQEVMQANPDAWSNLLVESRLPTSVDLLAPGAPTLRLLAAQPRPAGVHFHSIIGLAPSDSLFLDVAPLLGMSTDCTDGVVPYRSAHLEEVDSELVVQADHTHVHQHPLAVLEVRRILLEHLRVAQEEGSLELGPGP
jgi:pimeloyl-ACP methyl ester carboxylesterase